MNVLIVDDHPINRKLLAAQLEGAGHAVLEADDGVAALDKLVAAPVDALVADVFMPRMDGYRLCLHVRETLKLDLPIVFFSAVGVSDADRQLALRLGADAFVGKPATADAIDAALREASARRRARPPPGRDGGSRDGDESLAFDALAESRQRLALATESARIGIWDWDIAGNRMVWDAQMYALYGIRADDFSGVYDAWQRGLHPDDRARAETECADAIAGTRAFDTEFRVVWPDGEVRHIEAHGRVLRDATGTPLRMIGVNWDVTQRNRAQEAVNGANAMLEQRVAERTALLERAVAELEGFAYSVAHDLRAPLRAIDGFSRLLETDHVADLSGKAREYLQYIRGSAQHMGRLIADLLSFAQLNRQGLRHEIVQPEVQVRECIELLRAECNGRAIELDIGPLPACEGDASLLKAVWLNLLSNAFKYTRRTAAARIEVGCRDDDGEPTYFVRDNGVGFNMAYADKLFGMFQRLHRSEDYEGTGVGLATAQRIVQRHGGRIWAEAALNRGATFFFRLGREATPVVETTTPVPQAFPTHAAGAAVAARDADVGTDRASAAVARTASDPAGAQDERGTP